MINESCAFSIYKVTSENSHICKTDKGFNHSQLRYILNGKCQIKDISKEFNQDSVVYLPKNKAYELNWFGNKLIEFIVIEFNSEIFDKYTKIEVINDDRLYSLFSNLLKSENSVEQLSLFYSILSISSALLTKPSANICTIEPALEYIKAHTIENYSVKFLADMCFISESNFYLLFKEKMGMSPINYKNYLKIQQSKFLIKEGFSIEQISEKLGFCSTAFFRRIFKKYTKVSPSKYKKSL